ncbi:MAG: DNA integrity scanning diadenylate cyclase DisA [Actinomycetota bacterium]|jgi:diadenylate cyclase|nr:DNA integrity scanning diadenylate cyclase DisA [Actinomycetota bacterium]
MEKKEEKLLLESLKRVSPGTVLRTGIEYILQGKTGGLVVVGDSDEVLKLVNGGFYIGTAFTPAKFYELAKMDGAIILSSDAKKILYANTHLFPNPEIETSETGTRHRTAERVAKQTKNLVISISQKRDIVTLYIDNIKYMLEEPRVVLSKANQALQTLEKYKKGLDQLTFNLTIRELEDLVTLFDAVSVLQRSAIVQNTEKEVRKYIYELGADGRLLKMQVEELMANVVDDSIKIIKDYSHPRQEETALQIKDHINFLSSDEVLDLDKIAKLIGYDPEGNLREFNVHPRGIRIVNEARRLPQAVLNNLIERFGNLSNIMAASVDDLIEVNGMGKVRAKSLYDKLKKFSEYYLYNEPYNLRGGVVQKLNL